MTQRRLSRSALPMVGAALLLALVVGVATAQDADTKGEKELVRLTQKIDKTSSDGDAGRVTSKIVSEWNGTKFTFDAGTPPRALTAQDVQDLRARKLGFGEISILLALTAKQPDASTAKSLNEILAMRQAGEGWGKLARDLGYKNLGSVVKSVKATDKGVSQVAMQRPEKHDGKAEKPEKPGRPDKPERLEKPEKPEKPGR